MLLRDGVGGGAEVVVEGAACQNRTRFVVFVPFFLCEANAEGRCLGLGEDVLFGRDIFSILLLLITAGFSFESNLD